MLIRLGLKESYSGTIYLSGCNSASGKKFGYIGIFYDMIRNHCSQVKVKGNLNIAVTNKEGRQGVWTGIYSKEEYEELLRGLNLKAIRTEQEVESTFKVIEEYDSTIRSLLATGKYKEVEKEVKEIRAKVDVLDAVITQGKVHITNIAEAKRDIEEIAYDFNNRLTITLPDEQNVIPEDKITNARILARISEQLRRTKIAISD